ncbi:hypothetical protein [Mitsuaria sp. 7]|uniref:hypothetical protein n=1 Tax=Mitsuaria sp. 7 TaxID=1658665 RepID=UPI0012FA96AD|nr:hypothetical protein [Mitsuaria sp. 7]
MPLFRMTSVSTSHRAVRAAGLVVSLLALAALSACSRPGDPSASTASAEPTADHFVAGMQAYLAKRGDLCLAKTEWPIDLTQREIDAGARNALQMPVLERLGLASSTVAEVDVKDDNEVSHHMKVRRYALTETGRQFYVTREQPRPDGGKEARGDFCAAKLSLDKVVHWELGGEGKDRHAVVSYTYQVKAAPWTGDAELQKVFPVVAQVIRGAGSAQLQETFKKTETGWVAVDLL